MTKLLVVSHPCVTPVNQRLFAHLQRATGWEVTLVVPATWRDEYDTVEYVQRDKGFEGKIIPVPVWLAGNIPLHVYRSTLLGLLKRERPDAIYVHHEPYAAAAWQVCTADRLTRRCPIGFYAAQNIVKRYPFPFTALERSAFRRTLFRSRGRCYRFCGAEAIAARPRLSL